MAKNISNTRKDNISVLSKENIMYIIYLALIILPLYFRGSYFEEAYLPFIIAMSVFTLFYIRENYKGSRNSLIQNDSDIFLISLVLLYSLTFFYGVNKRSSLMEFAKYASYMSVFFISRDMGREEKKIYSIIDFIILGGTIVSIIGIGAMIGTWEYTDAYMGTRLASTFQYPNTLAAYASALYFLTMGRAIIEENKVKMGIYGGILTIFFSTLIFTSSRGMWLLFPLILLAYFIIVEKKEKVKMFFYSLFNLIIGVPFSFIFLKYIESSEAKLWGLYLMGIIVSIAIFYLLALGNKLINRVSLKLVFAIIGIMVIAVVGLGYYAINTTVALDLENQTSEPKTSSIARSYKSVFPNTEYILNVKGMAENNEEKAYAGRAVIYSTNDKGNNTHIGTYNIVESGSYDMEYQFNTLEDTSSIKIYLQNRLENTSITFEEVKIIDTVTNDSNTIPLKYKYIPEGIVSRVMSIDITDNSSQARIIFSKDALKLAKENVILGSGGDGWATNYKTIQSYPYWSKHVHNHFLQLLVEVGLLGLVLFFGFLLSILYAYIKYKREKEKANGILADTLLIGALSILGHAMIDFDLSLVAVSITLWTLFGLLSSMISNREKSEGIITKKLGEKVKKLTPIPVLLTLMACLIATSIYGGRIFVNKAIAAQDIGDIDKLESNVKTATILDPYNTEYKEQLINIYFFQNQNTSDKSYGTKAKDLADRLLDIGKYDTIVNNNVAQAYLTMGLIEEGMDLTDKITDMQPLTVEAYEQKVKTYLSLCEYYINKLELDRANEVATRGITVEEEINKAQNKTIRPMRIDNELNLDILKLKYYSEYFGDYLTNLQNRQRLVYYYDFSIDTNNDGEIDMLRTSMPKGSMIKHEPMTEGEDEFIRISNEGEVYGFKYVYPLTLEPNKTYSVELLARGDTRPETFNVYAWSPGAEDANQGYLKGIEVTDEWQRYIFEFTTDEDIEPGKQYIRIQHNGNDMGHVDIKDLIIFENK